MAKSRDIEEPKADHIEQDFSTPMDDDAMQMVMVGGWVWKNIAKLARQNDRSLADEFSNCYKEYIEKHLP